MGGLRPYLLRGLDVRMSRCLTGLRIGSLPFIADSPPRPQPSRNRVWRAFENRHAATDLADAFAQQRQNRRAFFHSRREMMRIAGEANRRLTCHQQSMSCE